MKATTSLEDFRTIMRALIAAYPRDNFIPNEYTFNLWYSALHDIDYQRLNKAAQAYIMANKFTPTIAEIRQLAYDLDAPADDLAAEEWARLMKALGHAGSPEAADYWNRLPETTKEIIGGFSEYREWANMPTVDLMSVQRPMFIKRFEEKERVRRFRGAVPTSLNPPVKRLEEQVAARLEEKVHRPGSGVSAPEDMIAALKRRLTAG